MKGFLPKCKRSLTIVLSLLILGGTIPVSNVTVQAVEAQPLRPMPLMFPRCRRRKIAQSSIRTMTEAMTTMWSKVDRTRPPWCSAVTSGSEHHEGYGLARERALGICIR